MSGVINELSHAKLKKAPLDVSKNPSLLRDILHIHIHNPTIFSDLIQGLPEDFQERSVEELLEMGLTFAPLKEDALDVILRGLDSEVKMHTTDVHEQMQRVQRYWDDKARVVEITKSVLETQKSEIDYILNKMGR